MNNTIELNAQKIKKLEQALKEHVAPDILKKTEEELLSVSEKYRLSLEQEEEVRNFKNKEIMFLKTELDGFRDVKESLDVLTKSSSRSEGKY